MIYSPSSSPSSRTILTVLELSFTRLFLAALIDCLSFSSLRLHICSDFPAFSYSTCGPAQLFVCCARESVHLRSIPGPRSLADPSTGYRRVSLCLRNPKRPHGSSLMQAAEYFSRPQPSLEQFTSYFGAGLVHTSFESFLESIFSAYRPNR